MTLLPKESVGAPSLEVPRAALDGVLGSLMWWWWGSSPWQRDLNSVISEIPFN